MRNTESELLVNFIERVPVVGQLWADALYTWIGVANALNMREMRDERLELPGGPNVIDLPPAPSIAPTLETNMARSEACPTAHVRTGAPGPKRPIVSRKSKIPGRSSNCSPGTNGVRILAASSPS